MSEVYDSSGDEEYDSQEENFDGGDEAWSSESSDEFTAKPLKRTQPTSVPAKQVAQSRAGPAPPRRRVIEEDSESEESDLEPAPRSTKITLKVSTPSFKAPTSGNRIITTAKKVNKVDSSEDDFATDEGHSTIAITDDDDDEEDYNAPAAKRRKLASPSAPARGKKTGAKKGAKATKPPAKKNHKYASDDDEGDFGSEDVLSDTSVEESSLNTKRAKTTISVKEPASSSAHKKASSIKIKSPKATKAATPQQSSSKKRARPRLAEEDEVEPFSEEDEPIEMDLADDDDDIIIPEDEDSFDSQEWDVVEDLEAGADPNQPKKLTARQRAMTGEERPELFTLAGPKGTQVPFVDPKDRGPINKPAIIKTKVERTQPPDDVMQEVTQIVGQLLHRANLTKPERLNIRDAIMFNPELTKFWSKPDGANYITIPLSDTAALLPASAGWSEPLSEKETEKIPKVHLKRGLLDPA